MVSLTIGCRSFLRKFLTGLRPNDNVTSKMTEEPPYAQGLTGPIYLPVITALRDVHYYAHFIVKETEMQRS